MITEEEIKEAAVQAVEISQLLSDFPHHIKSVEYGFIKGVKFASSQDNWISVSKRLPADLDENYLVAVRNKNKEGGIWLTDMATWTDEGWKQWNSWETVQYWQPLPGSPNK